MITKWVAFGMRGMGGCLAALGYVALASLELFGCGADDPSAGSGGAGAGSTSTSSVGGNGAGGGTGGEGGVPCDVPCQEDAHCEDGACVCDSGFIASGKLCIDVHECNEDPETCHPSAKCTNLPGSYTCTCPSGTVGEPDPGAAGCFARYSAISSGNDTTCALRIDGAAFCFGDGRYHLQLGNGSGAAQASPVQVGAASNWSSIVQGGFHGCGIKTTGNAWCWGHGKAIGDGSDQNAALPTYVSLDRTWTAISAGFVTTCAIESDGTLSCWGQGYELLPTHVSLVPMASPPDADWKAVVLNGNNACAQKQDGKLYCWGNNYYWQTGTTVSVGGHVATPSLVETAPGAADKDWAQFATGGSTCAIKTSGALYCWGRNAEGQLGDGTDKQTATPKLVLVPGVMPPVVWKLVRIGGGQACAVTKNGALYCWGHNQAAQVLAGAEARIPTPKQIGSDTDWADVAPGNAHTCALKKDGRVLCWGARTWGSTGEGIFGFRTVPFQVGQDGGWSGLTTNWDSVCAKDKNNKLHCWGLNEYGQFGNGLTASEQAPAVVAGVPALVAQSFGRYHACAIDSLGALLCTGSNGSGQLATGNNTSSLVYGPILSAGKPWASLTWKAVASGHDNTCAIGSDGSLYCTGNNCFGQLDATSNTGGFDSLVQVLPATPKDWVSVSVAQHVCATRADGTLSCWGLNGSGQIGNGASQPVTCALANKTGPFSHGAGWKHGPATGSSHTCAIKQDGTLYCWGTGTLGNGTVMTQPSPVQIGLDSDWAQVVARAFTCARKTSGALYCWGDNRIGQLGIEGASVAMVPAKVDNEVWTDVQIGANHGCGLRTGGTLWCWGSGDVGQNGLADSWSLTPSPIVEAE